MGVSASKVGITDKFNELIEHAEITESDEIWNAILSPLADNDEPTEGEFFGLVGSELLRRVRDTQSSNFTNLVYKTTERLEGLLRTPAVCTQGSVTPQILHCCRLISRIYPLIYEEGPQGNAYGRVWNETSTGKKTIDLLGALLHFPGFSVSMHIPNGVSNVWTTGVGCTLADEHSVDFVKQRISVVTALTAVLSEPMYSSNMSAHPCLDYWTSKTCEAVIFCSIFNWGLCYPRKKWSTDQKSLLGSFSTELLLISITYQPSTGVKNYFHDFICRVCQQKDLEWIIEQIHGSLISEYNCDTELRISLLWDLVANNRHILESVGLKRFVTPLIDLIGKALEDDSSARLAAFTLLVLTEKCKWCVDAGKEILAFLLKNQGLLERPSIEIATLIDAFWNCAPYLALTTAECTQLQELRIVNVDVREYFVFIKQHMTGLNPKLAEGEGAAETPDPWHAIPFEWDNDRRKWYISTIFGNIYRNMPQVFGKSYVKLFRVDRAPKDIAAELPKEMVSAGELAAGVVKSAANTLGININREQ